MTRYRFNEVDFTSFSIGNEYRFEVSNFLAGKMPSKLHELSSHDMFLSLWVLILVKNINQIVIGFCSGVRKSEKFLYWGKIDKSDDLESKRRWDFELFKHINKLKIYRFTAIDEINVREYRKDNPEKLAT